VRRLLEEQDKVLVLLRTERGDARSKGGTDSFPRSGACQVGHVRVKQERTRCAEPRCMTKWGVRDE